jgi:hypothetical protein
VAAAGEALREFVRGPVGQARAVQCGPHARYFVADAPAEHPERSRTFALLAPTAVRVPIGILLDVPLPPLPARVQIGDGAVHVDGRRHPITRWWPTRVTTRDRREAPVGQGDRNFRSITSERLGRGEGLTPEGDDELAGMLVALRRLGRRAEAHELATAVRARLDAHPNATTAVSAALLEAACDGHAVPPLLAWLREGCPPDSASRRALLTVGHTSGAALARGVESVVRLKEAAFV